MCLLSGSTVHESQYETQEHVKATHQLPLPPNALGNDDLDGILADLLKFVRLECGPEAELSPMFTLESQISVVNNALKFLNGGVASQLSVYPIEYLFYVLKKATCEAGMLPPPASIHITTAQFNLDPHEFLSDIGCEFHQQRDLTAHCSKSYVTRWAFAFAGYMCSELAIKMLPNRHMPSHTENRLDMGQPPNNDKQKDLVQEGDHRRSENAEPSDVTHIKKEPMIDYEEFINPDAVDALNSLDLDNIFEDDDSWGLDAATLKHTNVGENDYSKDGESIMDDGRAKIEDRNKADDCEKAPPPPPSIAEDLAEDCAIFTRRPKKQQSDCDSDQFSINELSVDETDESFVNKSEDRECLNLRPHSKTKSVTDDRERNRFYRREINSQSRWRSSSRSRSRSLNRDSRCHRRISSPRRNDRGQSRSSSRTIRDRNASRDNESRMPSRSPRRVKYERKQECRKRETSGHKMKLSPSRSKPHAKSVTLKYSRCGSGGSKKAILSPRTSHKGDVKDLSKKPYTRDCSPDVSPPKYRGALNDSKERLDHRKPTHNHKNVQKGLVPLNEAPGKSAITNVELSRPVSENVEFSKTVSSISAVSRRFSRMLPAYNSHAVGEGSSHPIPSHIPAFAVHTTYNSYHNGPESGSYYQLQEPMSFQQAQYQLHQHRLEIAKFNYLPENDLRHRIPGRSEFPSQMVNYSREQHFAYQYQASAWGCHSLIPWHGGYGSYLPNNYY